MAEIKVRELDDQVFEMLKARALSRGISLEAEVRTILTDAIAGDREALRHEAEAIAERIRRRNPGPHSDSVQIIRDERDAWG
jgi:plasmid stability protein